MTLIGSKKGMGQFLHRLKVIKDVRGSLVAGEFKKQIGFLPKRFFIVFDVPHSKMRGQHAHKKCHQFLVCLRGALYIELRDGRNVRRFRLNQLNRGIHVPPMVWCSHFGYRPGTILLVFASHHYDPRDYIRDYDAFLARVKTPH